MRRFKDNLCDNPPIPNRHRKQVSLTVEAGLEEKLWVLGTYGTRGKSSRIVDDALRAYFNVPAIKKEIETAYARWSADDSD